MYDKILVSQYIAMLTRLEDYFYAEKLIKWIKSCFAGDVAVSSKADYNGKMTDYKARNRGWRGPFNG